jgi:hypothetical protein
MVLLLFNLLFHYSLYHTPLVKNQAAAKIVAANEVMLPTEAENTCGGEAAAEN